jgi:hypothetical protein
MTPYLSKAAALLNTVGATARTALVNAWRGPTGRFDTYRPEAHYMRGPGPKWRAKHAHASGES